MSATALKPPQILMIVLAGSMSDNIANIATNSKHFYCDFRPVQDAAISASISGMEVVDKDWISARLTGERGEITRLAEYVGIEKDKMTKILKGNRQVQAKEVPLFISYFEGGHPPTRSVTKTQLSLLRVEPGEDGPTGNVLVPVFDLSASAGFGAVVDQEAEVYSLAFPPAYLKRLTSSSPNNLAIISVKGESMEPTLLDDDIVLLDASKTNLSYDGLFVLRFNDALHVKRIGRSYRKGHITIISDNKDLYPQIEAPVGEVEAVGKVLWYGRKV